jgi:periplasmic copper chaperone A
MPAKDDKLMRTPRVLLWAQAIALAALTFAQDAASAQGMEYRVGKIKVVAPWTRATPESSKVAGGFMSLINTGSEPDRLIGGSTQVSARLEIHEMHIVNGVAMMRQVNPGISLKPGAHVVLKPFAHHLMMMDLKQPLQSGQKIKGTLVFEKAGTVEIDYVVVPMGANGPAAGARAGNK